MDALLTAALVGTSRQPDPPRATGTPVDSLISALPASSVERDILLAAGAGALYRRAGKVAKRDVATPPACPEETRPALRKRCADVISDLLLGREPVIPRSEDMPAHERLTAVDLHALLPEALELIHQQGHRLPHHLLPQALAMRSAEMRRVLPPVLGERGRWLAGFNNAWRWAVESPDNEDDAVPADAEATWEHGDLAQRRAVLTRIRRYMPDTARDWLAATWKSEKADSRLAFLGVFEHRVSSADEPFLKEAMTDRSEKVRARATELLLQLPTSALHARLLSIADTCLSFKPRQDTWQSRIRALGKVQRQSGLEVQLPEEDGVDWGLAGIHEKPSGHDAASRRAWYFERVLSLVSPAHWSDRFDVAPADLIGAAESSDWSGALLRAWASAATRHHVEDWIGPLWQWWSGTLLRPGQESGAGPLLDALFRALPSDKAEAEVIRLLHSSDATAVQFAIDVLGNLPAPWTPAIGAAYVQALKSLVRNLPRTSQPMLEPREMSFYQSIPMAAYRLPHTCFNLVPQAWDIPEVPALLPWRRLLYRLSESILIRRFLRHELTS